jgi:hypothetical protein
MKPVVQKVRVGDVLHGTKNLRSYLRTCSMVRYFQLLDRRYGPKGEPTSLIYTPNKQDQFIVLANNHGRFAVWGSNQNVVLLFVNAAEGYMSRGERKRMDSNIFAQWFVRTQSRSPAVKKWPVFAHYLWASIHMNAWRNHEQQLQARFSTGENPEDLPFLLAESMGVDSVDRATIAHAVRESVTRGVFRNLPNSKKSTPQLCGGGGFGPSLDELPHFRSKLESLMRNPRLVSKAKTHKELDFAFLMNVKENPL